MRFKIGTSSSTHSDPETALQELYSGLSKKLGGKPDILFLHGSPHYDSERIVARLQSLAPGTALHGGTSCMGAMTESGFHSKDGRGLAALGICDPRGSYGVGAADLSEGPRAAAIAAARMALLRAGRPGELPAMVWITVAPGTEEEVLEGLVELFGPNVPIGGGSSGDNTVTGEWRQFANDEAFRNAVVVSVLFPSASVAFSFHNGYDPCPNSAKITRASGRTIQELDGRPAAEVYNEWTGGKIAEALPSGGNVLIQAALSPLGRIAGRVGKTPYFQLSHPSDVTAERGLALFTDIAVGDEVHLMKGSPEMLSSRAGRVVHAALRSAESDHRKPVGALVVYCAGCMFALQGQMDEVISGIRAELGDEVPFLGAFTFGEQGCFPGGENRHGNLMISVLTFLE